MEVKINREIRNYTEAIFLGLSMRQFIFSMLAVGVAVLLYFLLKPHVGMETVSWLCILGAAPFAAMGFIKYNGQTFGQLVQAWVRSELLMPKRLLFLPENLYHEAVKGVLEAWEYGLPATQSKWKIKGRKRNQNIKIGKGRGGRRC